MNTIKYNQHSCTTQFTDTSEFTVFSDSKEGIPTHVHQLLTLCKNFKYKNLNKKEKKKGKRKLYI